MRTVALACAITASAFIGPSAWADLFDPLDLDQYQEQWSQGPGEVGCYGTGGESWTDQTWMAQTFTAGKTGMLNGVEIGNTTGGVIWEPVSPPVVQIFVGEPGSDGFALAANSVGDPVTSDGWPTNGWWGVPFNYFVREGTMYSIVVRARDPGGVSVGATQYDSYYESGQPGEGRGALWAGYNGTDWVLQSTTEIPVYDMQFHTHVLVPLPAGVLLGILGLAVAGWRLRREMA